MPDEPDRMDQIRIRTEELMAQGMRGLAAHAQASQESLTEQPDRARPSDHNPKR